MMKNKVKKILLGLGIIAVIVSVSAVYYVRQQYVVPILMYHYIDHRDKESKLHVSPESFERQMHFLRKNKYNVIALDKIVRYIKEDMAIPRNTVSITFDDGYDNNYTSAFPILKKYHISATIFIISDKVGKREYLSWEQIQEMSAAGIDIGCHSRTHPNLKGLDSDALRAEISGSKKTIEGHINKEVKIFSYPAGSFDRAAIDMVKEAGYIGACTTTTSRSYPDNDIYALKRQKITRTSDNLVVFWAESSGYYLPLKERKD